MPLRVRQVWNEIGEKSLGRGFYNCFDPPKTERARHNSFAGIKNSQKWKFFGRAFGTVLGCTLPPRYSLIFDELWTYSGTEQSTAKYKQIRLLLSSTFKHFRQFGKNPVLLMLWKFAVFGAVFEDRMEAGFVFG
ncbi:hypothetical protein C8R44DRAFT_732691 [Mycena epipterygia]|nr:hypothetical protein C8R44DRAFT_732691 [Mycena epipterygia]